MPDDDLSDSITGLSKILSGQRPVRDVLVSIAEYAVQAIPGADGAGLTMLDLPGPQTVVASADFVHQIDDIQYSLGEGPCLLAVATGSTQTSGSLGGEKRWPRFGPRVGRIGVHSVLSLPLLLPDAVVGALNVYAHAKDAFDAEAIRRGELFAVPAAVAVHNAQVLADSQRLAGQLAEALSSRAVIDQAIGIIMSRSGSGPSEAFDRLRLRSQTDHVKVASLAQSIVAEAVRTARSRSTDAGSDSEGPPQQLTAP
jgi:transcriptional regulator with GAF, ATPase, and Fis domain